MVTADGGEDYGELLVSLLPPWFLCVEFAVEWGGRIVDSGGGILSKNRAMGVAFALGV